MRRRSFWRSQDGKRIENNWRNLYKTNVFTAMSLSGTTGPQDMSNVRLNPGESIGSVINKLPMRHVEIIFTILISFFPHN